MTYLPLSHQPSGLEWEKNDASPRSSRLRGWIPAFGRYVRGTRLTNAITGHTATASGTGSIVSNMGMSFGLAPTSTSAWSVRPGGVVSGSPGTLSMWHRWNSNTTNSGSNIYGFGEFFHTNYTSLFGYILPKSVSASIKVSGVTYSTVYHTSATGVWVHYAMTWRSDGLLRLYVNGLQFASTSLAGVTVPNVGSYGFTAVAGDVIDCRYYSVELPPAGVFALWAPQSRWDLYGVQVTRGRAAAFFATMMQHHHAMLAGGKR